MITPAMQDAITRVIGLFSLMTAVACAQSFTSIDGRVVDPTGGAISGAVVDLNNVDTGLKRSVTTERAGLFSFAQIPPGKYSLTAQAPGFSAKSLQDLQLLVNTPATVIVQLEVGPVKEMLLVTTNTGQVNTTDASLGNAIGPQAITELPFEARNPAGLLALQPGVTFFGAPSNYGANTTGGASINSGVPNTTADRLSGSVNGSKPDQNNITLDGVDINNHRTRTPLLGVLRVTLDSVQEFRTTTQNLTGGQDRGSGAQIGLVTRSGTNYLHGSLYEYTRNTLTSANSFFNNASGVPRLKLIRNTFGASVGGPAKKNRLFYFLNYEGRRDASDDAAVRIVPAATFRQGVLRYLNQRDGVSSFTPAEIKTLDPLGIGVDPAVLQVLNQYPDPNDATVGDGLNTAGYRFKARTPLRFNTYVARIDYATDVSGRNTVFWRGNLPERPCRGPSAVSGPGAILGHPRQQ
jgi:hypothetical protein